MRKIDIVIVAIVLATGALLARDTTQQARIDYLINSLGQLKGAVFIRNGSEYAAAAAKEHLQQKLNYVGNRIQTAEQFIKYCATESSMSHKPYQIRFADGSVVNTADYFTAKLREFDQRKQ